MNQTSKMGASHKLLRALQLERDVTISPMLEYYRFAADKKMLDIRDIEYKKQNLNMDSANNFAQVEKNRSQEVW